MMYCIPVLNTMREAALECYLVAGITISIWVELLSCFDGITRLSAALIWIFIGCFVAVRYHKVLRGASRPSPQWWEVLLGGGLLAVVCIVCLTGLLSAPNSADAMAYHLPRVVYWLQQQSVHFFPTVYFNQISMPPFAEYLALQGFLLTGDDRLVNVVQFSGYLVAIAGASLVAMEMGGSRMAQWLAALLVATLPGAVLQASGAKNDCVLAGLLLASVYFGLRLSYFWFAVAFALAIFTKSTAYLFLPPVLVAIILLRGNGVRILVWVTAMTLAVNGPHYSRNMDLSGSPLGFDSAQGDGVYRWRNNAIGLGATISNVLRHTSEQLGGRSERWNQIVFETVTAVHRHAGLDPNDPGTTWPGEPFKAPRNANHEANAHSRWHLLLYVLCGIGMLATVRRAGGNRPAGILVAATVAGFLLFCAYLKWQPFMQRLLLPLLALAAPSAAVFAGRLPMAAVLGIALLLLNNTRPYLLENWVRPLKGSNSLLRTGRTDQYFNDMSQWNRKEAYLQAVEFVKQTGCTEIGIDIFQFQLEYPMQALLWRHNPDIRFQHTGVKNESVKYSRTTVTPCVVVCLACGGIAERESIYSGYVGRQVFHDFVVFFEEGKSRP